MSNKRFALISFVMLFLFAVIASGGCGGSSSSSGTQQDNTAEEMPGMISVFSSPEFELVGEELEAELEAEGLNPDPPIHLVMIVSDDYFVSGEDEDVSSAAAQSVRASANLPEDKLAELSAKIKPYYDSGDVIAIFWPSSSTINDVYEAVGEPPMNVDLEALLDSADADISDDIYPEIYAIAKRYNGDVAYNFSYLVPGAASVLGDIIKEIVTDESGDVAGEVGEDPDAEPAPVDEKYAGMRENYLFQARRYADFVRWAAHIDSEMEKQKEYVASSEFPLRSAAFNNESKTGDLFNYGAQLITVNLSYKHSRYSYVHFSGAAHYTVYSFHNFSDNKDYYYVQANYFVNPEAYKKYKSASGNPMTSGSMCWYQVASSISDPHNLFSHAPHNVNRSRSVSDGTSYSTTRTTGHKVGVEMGAEIGTEGAKISAKGSYEYSSSTSKNTGYSHSATWTANDWEIIDKSDSDNPLWRVDFKVPTTEDGYSYPTEYNPYRNGNVPEASTRRNDLDAEWMWQVESSNKGLSIKETLWAQMRQTVVYANESRQYWYFTGKTTGAEPLAKPPHIIARPKKFDAEQAGDLKKFNLLCSGKWVALSDSDWCQVSPSSGEATGEDEQTVFIYVKEYEQSANLATRTAQIMIKDTETGQIQTLRVTQANQRSQR